MFISSSSTMVSDSEDGRAYTCSVSRRKVARRSSTTQEEGSRQECGIGRNDCDERGWANC